MTDRTPCSVPYCRRTCRTRWAGMEWICDRHWRTVDRATRQRLARAKRELKTFHLRRARLRDSDPARFDRLALVRERLRRRLDCCWDECRREAIEAAAGIG